MAAGDEPVSFNRKSADLIGRVVKDFRGLGRGEIPLPKRRRNPDGGGTDSSGGSSGWRVYRVTTDVPKATGNLSAEWSTTGRGHLVDDATGIEDTGSEIVLVNRHYVAFPVDCQVYVSDNGKIIGPCGPAPAGWWDGS